MKSIGNAKEKLRAGLSQISGKAMIFAANRGDLPEMTGKAWMFVAIIVGVVVFFGPQALDLVKGALGQSLSTTSSAFSLPT